MTHIYQLRTFGRKFTVSKTVAKIKHKAPTMANVTVFSSGSKYNTGSVLVTVTIMVYTEKVTILDSFISLIFTLRISKANTRLINTTILLYAINIGIHISLSFEVQIVYLIGSSPSC